MMAPDPSPDTPSVDGRIVDQWTPLWIRAQLLDEPAASQARAILAAIDEDRLTHHRGALRDAYYTIVGTDPPVPNLNQILSYTPTEDGTDPCPACNDSGVLSTMGGDTIGPCPECAPCRIRYSAGTSSRRLRGGAPQIGLFHTPDRPGSAGPGKARKESVGDSAPREHRP